MSVDQNINLEKYKTDYLNWLKQEMQYNQVGNYVEITAPFLDSMNDYIQIYFMEKSGIIYFSDDAYTINNLEARGISFNAAKKAQMKKILQMYGASLKDREIVKEAASADFAKSKHLFLQAVLRINDLYMNVRSKSRNIFTDDIKEYFRTEDIYCTEDVQFTGKSGFLHSYDFLLQRTKNMPTRLCAAMNTPRKQSMENILFSWTDTLQAREDGSELIVFINDEDKVQPGIEEAFSSYNVKTIKWTERKMKDNLRMLSA